CVTTPMAGCNCSRRALPSSARLERLCTSSSQSEIFGLDSSGCRAGFETGSSFDPVTNGIDVAVKPLPGGGALVVADCE
ncbi:unnamed protein product, partial [Polarella glacialis]